VNPMNNPDPEATLKAGLQFVFIIMFGAVVLFYAVALWCVAALKFGDWRDARANAKYDREHRYEKSLKRIGELEKQLYGSTEGDKE
jgi:hypothetical protein